MSENVNEQIKRLDTLDQKEDKKVSLVAGKEKELTETYLSKTDELLSKADELDNADPEKQKVKDDLTGLLKEIDEKTLEEKEQEFENQIDQLLNGVDQRLDAQNRLLGLGGNFWEEFKANDSFEKTYEKFIKEGKDIDTDNLSLLENYAEESQEIGLKYQETMTYFDEKGELPTTETNEALESFFGQQTVEKILNGEINDPDNVVKKLEELTTLATEEKQKCEDFRMSLVYVTSGKNAAPKFGSMLFKLTQDKGALLDVYAVLADRNGLTAPQIMGTLRAILSKEEFNRNWEPEEFKKFMVEAVLRGAVDENAVEKMEKEERAKKIFNERQKELDKALEEHTKEAERIEKEINDLKKEAGSYGNFENFDDGTTSKETAIIDPTTSKEESKTKIFDFKMLARMEADLKKAQLEISETATKRQENEAMFTIALFRINNETQENHAVAEEVFDDFDRAKFEFATPELLSKTGQFTEIERMRIEKGVKEKELREAKDLCEDKEQLRKELKYRQALEGGRQLDEETKSFVEAKKFEELRRVSTERSEIKKLIEKEEKEITDAINRYGSIEFVPPDKKPALFNKAKNLIALLGTSLNCMNKCVELENELQAIGSENITKETIKERLGEDYEKQKKLLSDTGKFLTGKSVDFPPPNEISPDLAMLMFNNFQNVVDEKVGTPIGKYAESADKAAFILNSQIARMEEYKHILPNKAELLSTGISAFENMENQFLECRKELTAAGIALLRYQFDKDPFFVQHPELIDEAKKMAKQVVEEIKAKLRNNFSDEALAEIRDVKNKLKEAKDDMFWDIVKFAAVFALSVAAAMLTAGAGGILAVSLMRVAGATRFMGAAQFVGSNLGMAAGSTFGSRLAMEATDFLPGSSWGDRVDWSAGALAKDFGKTFACAVLITGAGSLIGEKIAMNTAMRTGGEYTYAELSEMGLTRLSVFEKLFNPFGKFAKKEVGVVEQGFAKKAGGEFLEELAEESRDEMAEAIDNQLDTKLGLLISVLSAAKRHNVDVDIKTGAEVTTKLENLGVNFNKNLKRLELSPGTTAIDFAANFKSELGETGHAVETWINDDGSVGIRVKGADVTATIHPQENSTDQDLQSPSEKPPSFMDRVREGFGVLNEEMTAAPALGFLGAGKIEGFLRGVYRGVRKVVGTDSQIDGIQPVQDDTTRVEDIPGLTGGEKELLRSLYPDGIENSHFNQRNTGDCYLLAGMHGAKLKKVFPYMVAKNVFEVQNPEFGKGWIVRFADGHEVVVTERMLEGQSVWDDQKGEQVFKKVVKGQKGDVILELAFAIRRQENTGGKHHMLETEGGSGYEALEAFLGDIGTIYGFEEQNDFPFSNSTDEDIKGRVLEQLDKFAAESEGMIMTAATPSGWDHVYFGESKGNLEHFFMDPQMRILGKHAFTVTKVDAKNRTVTVVDPHDTRGKQITITYDEFSSYFSSIYEIRLDQQKIEARYGETRFAGAMYLRGKHGEPLNNETRYRYSIGDKKLEIKSETRPGNGDVLKVAYDGENGIITVESEVDGVVRVGQGREYIFESSNDILVRNIGNGEVLIARTAKSRRGQMESVTTKEI